MEASIIKVGGISCQGCVRNISAVLTALPGVASAEVLLEAGEARVSFDPQVVTQSAGRCHRRRGLRCRVS